MGNAHHRKVAKTFTGELYEEDPQMVYALHFLEKCPYSCAYIWHDKDTHEDGSPKKKHLHFIIKYPVKKSINAVSLELQIPDNYIDTCKNESSFLLYLIHRGWSEKYQYEPEEVKGNGALYTRFIALTEDESEDDRVLRILQLLENENRPLGMVEFIRLCCEAGIYAELRRGGYLLVQALKEHNEKYYFTAD